MTPLTSCWTKYSMPPAPTFLFSCPTGPRHSRPRAPFHRRHPRRADPARERPCRVSPGCSTGIWADPAARSDFRRPIRGRAHGRTLSPGAPHRQPAPSTGPVGAALAPAREQTSPCTVKTSFISMAWRRSVPLSQRKSHLFSMTCGLGAGGAGAVSRPWAKADGAGRAVQYCKCKYASTTPLDPAERLAGAPQQRNNACLTPFHTRSRRRPGPPGGPRPGRARQRPEGPVGHVASRTGGALDSALRTRGPSTPFVGRGSGLAAGGS